MEQTKVDLRSDRKKARDAEHNKIVNRYLAIRSNPEYANYSDHSIMKEIADNSAFSVSTVHGVRQILVKNGVYQNKH